MGVNMLRLLWVVILTTSIAQWVWAQNGTESMPMLWRTDAGTYLESGPTVADQNGAGLYETNVAGREELIALNGDGQVLWRWKAPGRFMTYPSVWFREGQTPLLYAGDTSGALTCLYGAGAVVWQKQLDGRI